MKILVTAGIILLVSIFAYLLVLKSGRFRNSDTLNNKLAVSLFDFNRFKIQCLDSVPRNFNILWRCYGDERYLFKNGKECEKMKNIKGVNVFEISFADSVKFAVYQVKINWWHTNDYFFTFSKKQGKIRCDLQIEGLDEKFVMNGN